MYFSTSSQMEFQRAAIVMDTAREETPTSCHDHESFAEPVSRHER